VQPRRDTHGIVFDLDGVLIHSTGCHRAAFEEVLRPLGISDFDYAPYAGWRTVEVVAAEFERCGLAADNDAIRVAAERKTQLARQKLLETNPLAEGCADVLRRLAADYRLGLASSGSRGSVHAFLKANDFGGIFQSVLSGDDVAHAKPDPEIYSRSFDTLGLAPQSCLVVEDAVSGIESARRAGAEVVGITGTTSAEVLRTAGAVRVLSRLCELVPLLAEL
jgi:beta-phosphoglucomutase